MNVTIIPSSSSVSVDGRSFNVSMLGVPGNLHAVQWDTDSGHEEWTDRDNTSFGDIAKYQDLLDLWQIKADEADVPPTEDELRSTIRSIIGSNTPGVIADFTYNSKNYRLTRSIVDQLQDIALLLLVDPTPADQLPIEIVMGSEYGVDDVTTISSMATFQTVFVAVMTHIKDRQSDARILKTALESMTLIELQNWTDPRL